MYRIKKAAATIYGWDRPLLTFIYPGFDCGSSENHSSSSSSDSDNRIHPSHRGSIGSPVAGGLHVPIEPPGVLRAAAGVHGGGGHHGGAVGAQVEGVPGRPVWFVSPNQAVFPFGEKYVQ